MLALLSLMVSCLLASAVCTVGQDRALTINGGVLNGKATSLPKPEYPADARKENAQGSVAVTVIIDEEGNVTSAAAAMNYSIPKKVGDADAEISEPTPADPLLREAAEKAALGAHFTPTLLEGRPVKVTGIIVYTFSASPQAKIINGGVLNGKALTLPSPVYPPAARAVNASGTVTVQIVVDEQGNVTSAQAVSGHPLLRAAAVEAANQVKFAPTRLSGEPVKITGVITYNFAVAKADDK